MEMLALLATKKVELMPVGLLSGITMGVSVLW